MAVMSGAKRLSLLVRLLIFSIMKGALTDVSATVVIGMNNTSALFECSKAVTLRCKAGTSFANWQIAYLVEPGTSSSAQCFGSDCLVQNNFTGRYKFTYSSATGISDLHIDPVVIEDDGREYKCNDGTQSPLRATVKLFPTSSSFALHKEITSEITHEVSFTLRLNCTADNVSIVWYLTQDNGVEVEIAATSTERNPCSNGECTSANTSVQISSILALGEVSTGNTFGVNISYEFHTFHIPIEGSYKLKEKAVPVDVLSPTCFELIWCIILVVLVVISIVILLVVFIILSLVRRKNKVDDRPDMPTDFKLVPGSITETSATFSWISGNHPTGIQMCVLCYKPFNKQNTTRENLKVMANELTQKKLDNLEPESKYRCYVYAKNSKGASNYTDHIDFVTLGRPDKPTKFQITQVTDNSLSLSWKSGLYDKYDQSFILKYTNKETDTIETVDIPGKTFKHILTPLAEGIKYELVLYAKNKYGESDEAGPLIQMTKGLPETPTDFQIVRFEEKTVTMEWKSGKYRKYQQTFVIRFRLKCLREIPWKKETAKDQDDILLQHTVTNLKEGSTYEFQVLARNILGYSDPSETLVVETKGKPEAPSDLRVVERRSKSITIGWKPGEYRRDTQKFVVNFRRVGREGKVNKWKQKEVVDDGIKSSFKFNIGDLVANKLYDIFINSTNLVGSSTMSDVLTVRTNPLLPQPPTEFMCLNVSEYTAQVSWKPKYYKQTKQSFLLRWAKLTDTTQISEIIKFDNRSKTVDYNIPDLSPGTDYELCVWSIFEDLEDRRISESCKVLEITTKEKTADENVE